MSLLFIPDDDTTDDASEGGEEIDESDLADGSVPTPKRRKLAREDGLRKALDSGLYPQFLGVAGPSDLTNPLSTSSLEFVKILWPDSLCEYIASQTNAYAIEKGAQNFVDTNGEEIWLYLGINILMGYNRLPTIADYWGTEPTCRSTPVKEVMSLNRFRALRRYLHCEDNQSITNLNDLTCKIRTVVSTLSYNFLASYNPSQQLAVDEMMVKYKGRKGGKVYMPKKPIRVGFKVWSLSCSCCGYLCSFQVYSGKPTDSSGMKVTEKGLKKRVVTDLVEPFKGANHVVYMDNYYTSGPLIETLEKDKLYVVGTIQQNASGFPDTLKGVKPPKGTYVAQKVRNIRYFVFHDRKVVCFATNVFPEVMPDTVVRLQPDGKLRHQSVPPLLPAYNKFMGGVDRTGQIKKTYGYDRKSRRYWLRLFFYLLDVTIGNAYILYKHNCRRENVRRPMISKCFRINIVRELFFKTKKKYTSGLNPRIVESPSSGVCTFVKAADVGLKRGRCHLCVREKERAEQKYTVYACSVCKVRLCVIDCFARYHAVC